MYQGILAMKKRCGVLMLTLFFVTGCAMDFVAPKEPTAFIPDRSSEVVVGQMDRSAVRRMLGAPQISSAYWGFDLFSSDIEQTDLVFAVTPWPIPFARFKDLLRRYTLVAYDSKGRASAVATGIFRKPAAWRNVSPIERNFMSLHLRAGDLMFFVDPEGAREANLLVAPGSRDAFLRQAGSSNGGTVVLGCGDRGCADQVSVDARPVRRLPLRTAHGYWFTNGERDSWLEGVEPQGVTPRTPWIEALVALKLAPGEHILEFSAEHLGGKASLKLVCLPGEVTYVMVNASSDESFWKPALVDWQINRSNTMPEYFVRRPLVLIDDGQWYVDVNLSE